MTRHRFNVYRITDTEIQRIYDLFSTFEMAVIDLIRHAYPNQPSELEENVYEVVDEAMDSYKDAAEFDTLQNIF